MGFCCACICVLNFAFAVATAAVGRTANVLGAMPSLRLPADRGAAAAFGNASGICMPWIVGWVADRRDLHWGLAISALAPGLMLLLVLGLWRGRVKVTPNNINIL